MSFEEAVARVVEELKKEGFGVITEIDLQAALKAKLGVDFRPYRIIGACNPPLAHKAVQAEDKIGVMLPCNVLVQEHAPGQVEVSSANPSLMMDLVGNPALSDLAREVTRRLRAVLARL